MLVRFLKAIAGSDFGYSQGQEVEVNASWGGKLIAAGTAEEVIPEGDAGETVAPVLADDEFDYEHVIETHMVEPAEVREVKAIRARRKK